MALKYVDVRIKFMEMNTIIEISSKATKKAKRNRHENPLSIYVGDPKLPKPKQ